MKTFDYLINHPALLQPVVELGLQTFGYLNPGQTFEMREALIKKCLNTDKLPITFVAFENDQLIGTTTLHPTDLPTYTKVSPWLASVIIHPAMRQQGMGSWMVQETMKKAAALGISTWYLYTPDRESFYARMGWKSIDTTVYNEVPGVIMRFDADVGC